jgi:hypothetical protein
MGQAMPVMPAWPCITSDFFGIILKIPFFEGENFENESYNNVRGTYDYC